MSRTNPKQVKASEPSAPAELTHALAASPAAFATWDSLTPIARRDFISWIESAKQEQTRLGRIVKAVSMLESGKRRPCCYSIMPLDFHLALKAVPHAKAQWSNLMPDKRRDWLDWIESAKQQETRSSRIEQACVLLAAGEHCP